MSQMTQQPPNHFNLKSSTRDLIISNIQRFMGLLLNESTSSCKDDDSKVLIDENIQFVNLLNNLDGSDEFRARKKMKRDKQENGGHQSEADEVDEPDEDHLLPLSEVDKKELIKNLIKNQGYVSAFCSDAKEASFFNEELKSILALLRMNQLESEMMVEIVNLMDEEDGKSELNKDFDGNDSNACMVEVASLKIKVEQLKDELKRVEQEYQTKLNKQIDELRKEFKALSANADPRRAEHSTETCKSKNKMLANRVQVLEKKIDDQKQTFENKELIVDFPVNKVKELFEKIGSSRSSDVFAFNSLNYQLMVRTKQISEGSDRDGKYLSFQLYYCGPHTVTAQLYFELRLLSRLQGKPNRVQAVNYSIKKPGCYGFAEFIREEKLFDSNFGFVKKDTICLQAFLKYQK